MTRFKRNVHTFRRGSSIKVFYHPEKGSALSTIGLFSEGATAARCAGKHTRITVNVLKFGTLYAMLFFFAYLFMHLFHGIIGGNAIIVEQSNLGLHYWHLSFY